MPNMAGNHDNWCFITIFAMFCNMYFFHVKTFFLPYLEWTIFLPQYRSIHDDSDAKLNYNRTMEDWIQT